MSRKKAGIILFAAAAAAAGVLAWLSVLRHVRFASTQDLALFDQLLWNVRQGHGLWTTLSGNSWLQFPHHFYGEHVSPILFLLAWPAGLTPGPEALLVLQALAVMLAALPVARIAAAETGRPEAGLAAGLTWLALPGLWGAVLFDFHMEAFEALFLFAFWLALREGRRACWLWALFYMACKEDAPLYLAAVALAGVFVTGHRRLGLAVFLAAAAYGLVIWLWVQPACSPAGRHLLGERLALPAGAAELAPWLRLHFLEPSRWQALGGHLLAFGLLPLLAGPAMLPWVGAVGLMWLSNDFEQAHGLLHYPLTLYPLLFLAAAVGLRQLERWAQRRGRAVRLACWSAAAGLALAGLGLGWWNHGRAAVITALGRSNAEALRRAPVLLSAIPPDGRVCAALTLTPHLSRRRQLEVLMNPATDAEWIATRLDGVVYPCLDHQEWLAALLLPEGSDYGVAAFEPYFAAVLRRGHPCTLNARVLRDLLSTVQLEDLNHRSGRVVRDGRALDGLALRIAPGDRNEFAAFGRYRDLPAGNYRVAFRIRSRAVAAGEFAVLEVTENRGRTLRASRSVSETLPDYTEVALTAVLEGTGGVEFRIRKTGPGWLWTDQISWSRQEEPGMPADSSP